MSSRPESDSELVRAVHVASMAPVSGRRRSLGTETRRNRAAGHWAAGYRVAGYRVAARAVPDQGQTGPDADWTRGRMEQLPSGPAERNRLSCFRGCGAGATTSARVGVAAADPGRVSQKGPVASQEGLPGWARARFGRAVPTDPVARLGYVLSGWVARGEGIRQCQGTGGFSARVPDESDRAREKRVGLAGW